MEASIVSIAADENAKSAGIVASSPSVLRWLGRREDNWLLIFDGADVGYKVVESFLPPGKHGNVLISSRNPILHQLSLPPSAHMHLLELDENVAVKLSVKLAKVGCLSLAEQGHVRAIVQEACCLPLTVDQAASSIATKICHIDEYVDVYKQRRRRLFESSHFKGSSIYDRSVYTSWEVSFAELERRASASLSDSTSYKAAILILQLLSFFPLANGVCEETFHHATDTKSPYLDPLRPDSEFLPFLQQTEDNEWDSSAFHAGIRILPQFSLIRTDENFTQADGMHCLVHEWMQDRLPKFSGSEMALLDIIAYSSPLAGGNPNAVEDVGAEAEPFNDSFDNDGDTSSGSQATPGPGTQTESSSEQPTTPDVSPAIATSREVENAAETVPIQ
jgi:hypothetical protein